jgi:hypothetical protein
MERIYTMRILEKLYLQDTWERFLISAEEKRIGNDQKLERNIKQIIKKGVKNIDLNFPIPVKKEIAKYKNSKKRTVYTFGEPYNTYMKAINFILQESEYYSTKFCINSVAYQKGKSVKHYVLKLKEELKKGRRKYYIKSDFSDYFNSIDQTILFQKLNDFLLPEDNDLKDLLIFLLQRPEVQFNGQIINIIEKGVMAGIPISGYLANVYMNDVDWIMYRKHIYYTRYADDVIILTNNIEKDKKFFEDQLTPLKVTLNPKKVDEGLIKEGLVFLGFHIQNREININQRALDKMKRRIKRRSKWFNMWLTKNKVRRDIAAKTFIEGMNGKFYAKDSEDQTCWMEWYGKIITTDIALKEIDNYMAQYIRYILTGKQKGYKKNAEVPYEKLKELGFRPLVNEYWEERNKKNKDLETKEE